MCFFCCFFVWLFLSFRLVYSFASDDLEEAFCCTVLSYSFCLGFIFGFIRADAMEFEGGMFLSGWYLLGHRMDG